LKSNNKKARPDVKKEEGLFTDLAGGREDKGKKTVTFSNRYNRKKRKVKKKKALGKLFLKISNVSRGGVGWETWGAQGVRTGVGEIYSEKGTEEIRKGRRLVAANKSLKGKERGGGKI